LVPLEAFFRTFLSFGRKNKKPPLSTKMRWDAEKGGFADVLLNPRVKSDFCGRIATTCYLNGDRLHRA
jgi:hypothetical protein